MRKMILVLIGSFCFLPLVTLAQTSHASWSALNSLQSGQSIQVINTASKKYSGTFIRVSDTAIVLRDATAEESIRREDVQSVKVAKTNQRFKHALIGAAAGGGSAAVFGALAAYCSHNCIIGSGEAAAAFGGMGAVIGAVVGAVVPAHGTTIYQASAH